MRVAGRIGDTKHLTYGSGEFIIHDIMNIGETEMLFATAEFLEGSAQRVSPPPPVLIKLTGRPSAQDHPCYAGVTCDRRS